jgi:hypothetical protein
MSEFSIFQYEKVMLSAGCPKRTSTGLEGLFNFHVQEAETVLSRNALIKLV